MDIDNFDIQIKPFFWVEHRNNVSVCLNVGEYKTKIFHVRKDDCFEGNGYDWSSLAQVFLNELMPELANSVRFDSEADMFCAYSDDRDALKTFILSFKKVCDNKTLIEDLVSRVKLD